MEKAKNDVALYLAAENRHWKVRGELIMGGCVVDKAKNDG